MPDSHDLTDTQLLQYSRQIMLPQIDVSGQQKLLDACVLVLGAGGLGCPALFYLATAGVGHIVIVDHDEVDISNMQRQILYSMKDIGRNKAIVASEKLKHLAAESEIMPKDYLLDDNELLALVQQADIVLDGTDNFQARYRHNEVCCHAGTPIVSGAVIRFEGQVATFDPSEEASPCYYCLYPDAQDEQLKCSESGVLGPVAGMIGCAMATEAIKLITGIGETLVGKLMLLDALNMEWRTVKLRKDKSCPICSSY